MRPSPSLLRSDSQPADFPRFFCAVTDLMCAVDRNGFFALLNPAWESVLGAAEDELHKVGLVGFAHPEDRESLRATLAKAALDRGISDFRCRLRCSDWSYRWYAWNLATPDGDGLIFGIGRDVTLAKHADERLQRQLQQLRSLHIINEAILTAQDLRAFLSIFLDQVTSQLYADAAALLVFNSATARLEYHSGRGFRTPGIQHTSLPIGQGLAGLAARDRRPMSVPDLFDFPPLFHRFGLLSEEQFISYCGAPILVRERLLGVLETFYRRRNDPDEDWLRFLEMLAASAGCVLEKIG